MSNNKQIMKLYTEEQVRKAIELAQECDHDGYYPVNFDYSQTEILEHLTPVELPSDEEIETYINSIDKYHIFKDFYCDGFANGAKWTRDKIQGGNK